jgi:Pro-kumamolisin, activation domain/Bacterial Ig-like domain (group 3)
MRSRQVSPLLLSAVTLFAALTPVAHAAVQNRIASSTTGNGSRVALSGTIGSHARHSVDLGLAAAGRKLESLSLRFSMTDAQQADLTQLLADQLNPSSPRYHQWLTSEEFGARYGLSSADITKVSAWLTSQGFAITGVAKSSTFITFSGTVAQAQQAFGTTIHNVSLNGEQHYANLTDPTLPSSIAGVVLSVTGLDDFRVKPRSRASPVVIDPTRPGFTTTINGTVDHFIAPGDFYTIYNATPLFTGGTTGAGITIAVMGVTSISTADVNKFQTSAGLPSKAPTLTLVPGSQNPGVSAGDIDEAQLDVEWSGAAAPGATINFVYSTDIINGSLTYAIDTSPNIAPIITISYGGCENGFGSSLLASYNQLLQMANAKGITVMSSSGDSGATDCDVTGLATEGRNVDFPSSSPYVTSTGGTQFSGDVTNSATYWNTGNSTTTIANLGAVTSSVKSYIPEIPWNETTAANGLDAGGAAGGGVSAYFSKPAWQVATGVPADGSRDLPDISLNAAAEHDGYLVCSQGSCVNGFLAANGAADVFGGTSFVAPAFAGILALIEQKIGNTTGLGNIGPTLYGLVGVAGVYHDITTGNNSVPCSQGTPDCPNGGSTGFLAASGYDQASGLGSFDINAMATNWKNAIPTGTGSTIGASLTRTALTTTNALCAVVAGAKVPLSVTVVGTGGTPTGSVQFFVDNTAISGGSVALSSGTATYTLDTTSLASGGHNISAVYSGDATFAGSKGTLFGPNTTPNIYPNGSVASFDVVSGKDFSLTPCTGSTTAVTVASGATSTGITLTVTPANGFTGAVTLTATNNDGMAATTTFTPASLTVGSTAVTTSLVIKASQTTTAQLSKPALIPHSRIPSGKAPWYAAGSGASLACLLLITLPRRRRWGALLAAVISVAALTAVGCGGNTSTTGGTGGGGGGGTGTTITNASSGTYTFTITAVSGTLVHSTQVTVTVP